MLRIAISKGRVAKDALTQLKSLGFTFSELPQRQLWAIDDQRQLELIFLKAQDVPLYVEKGVADLGIAGKDVLMENPLPLLSLMDLSIGQCHMCLAGPSDLMPDEIPYLRLASKYPNLAKAYLEAQGQSGLVVSLAGSVELAPLLGVSDAIVDIVESGATLKAHDLIVYKTLYPISSILVANANLYRQKRSQIQSFADRWAELLKVAV